MPLNQTPANEDRRIAIAVSNPDAKEITIEAIRDLGVTPVPLDDLGDLPSVSLFCSGSVCDLHEPQTVVTAIQTLRAADPTHPVLVIVLADQGPSGVELPHGDIGVRQCVGEHAQHLRNCLPANLEWLIEYHPVDALLETMMKEVASPSSTTTRFVEWSIRTVHAGVRAGIPTGARDLGVSTRTLARHLREDQLPSPIELNGWVKLLAVSHRSDLNRTSLAASARAFNFEANRLYQLRRRLMRKTSYGGGKSDRPMFPFVLRAFRERCAALRPVQ